MNAGAAPLRTPRRDVIQRLLQLTGLRPQVVVAFSGGLDSTMLAHVLWRARRRLGGLRLVHVDHGLQADSGDWSRQCARQARAWRVPFTAIITRVRLRRGESPEAAARAARYTALASVMTPGEVLVTAQHRDDQVETLLLQLFRGAGVAGLAAMPPIAPFGPGRIARPLLDITRADIEKYARRHRLRWIEDPTNEQVRFDRNYLRHRVLPGVRARWQGVDQAVARTARHMAEAAQLLEAVASRDLAHALDGDGLHVAALRALPLARRRNALRAFIAASGCEPPPTSKLTEMSGALLEARADAQPQVEWAGGLMRRRGGRLLVDSISRQASTPAVTNTLKSWRWEQQREYTFNGAGGALRLIDDKSGPIDLDRLPAALELRERRGGEFLRPGVRARTQSLKKLLQAARIPAEARAQLPLLYAGDRLIAAGDRWIDASVQANGKSRRRARLKLLTG